MSNLISLTMEKYLTSLFDYKVKKHALISALVFFIVDKLIYLMHHDYADSFVNHIRFNYLIALSLLIATSSKDKVDDERSMLIRYSILKSSFSFFVVVFGIMALFSNSFGIQSFS